MAPSSSRTERGCLPWDLRGAKIIIRETGSSEPEKTAGRVLVEEIEKRTGIRWSINNGWPEKGPMIALCCGQATSLCGRPLPRDLHAEQPEGYSIRADPGTGMIWIRGTEGRGVLFGVGRLLREIVWGKGQVSLAGPFVFSSAPAYPIRGHQLGYRATANTYDAWDEAQYEQYVRELAFFGANCIENIPLQDRSSPVMKVCRQEMNRALSEICQRYDQDYWVWTPADFDLKDPDRRSEALREHEAFYADTPRLDAIFVPGGDPGHNHPQEVMPFLKDLSERLLAHHPQAKIWISLQGFRADWVDDFYIWVAQHEPDWLGGVVEGPSSPGIPETRRRLPAKYGLRHYPDITHTVRSQYPTPWWDPAYAFTLGREPVNPEPVRYARVHNLYAPYCDGFLSYSDGAHDDVNKTVWSALGWDPNADLRQILVQYCRVFFNPQVSERAADGIFSLENNWRGALATHGGVEATLALWRSLEAQAPELSGNWRWQMCLLRAHYDAYIRRRLLFETDLERAANTAMLAAEEVGSEAAATRALAVLKRADIGEDGQSPAGATDLREMILSLCEALFQSIGLQSSVERYHASGSERGAVLDFLDHPLNNRWWLEDEIAKLRDVPSEEERVARIKAIASWEDPGKGGYYDDIGHVGRCPRVIRGEDVNTDPEMQRGPGPDVMWWDSGKSRMRQTWITKMDWPLGLRYEGLDPNATYRLRTTGFRDCFPRLNNKRLIPTVDGKGIGEIKEFPIPRGLIRDGTAVVSFDVPFEPDLNWRVQSRLTEVWLVRDP